jgi:hypothetical protein
MHAHSQTTESMTWPAQGDEPVVRAVIPDDATAAKLNAQGWARENQAKIGVGVWMWWSDGSRSDDGRVGAASVYKHGHQWTSRLSCLGTVRMEVFNAELWAIGLALEETI